MYVGEDAPGGLRSPHVVDEPSGSRVPLHRSAIPDGYPNAGIEFDVHLVETQRDRDCARDLLNRMYDWRGYGANHVLDAAENSTSFAVSLDEEVVCTLTLRVDAGAGLTADKTFPDVLGEAREVPRASLCELTKFACSPSKDSRFLLASMFHTIFIFGTEKYNCTDLFIEVNPRHIRFYETMLGFKKVSELRTNKGVDAPSQLMRLKVADIASNIKRHAGCNDSAAKRSLYPYFLSEEEEQAVRAAVRSRFGSFAESSARAEAPVRLMAVDTLLAA